MPVARATQKARAGAPARAGPDGDDGFGLRAFTAIEFPHQSIAGVVSHEG